MIMAYKLPGTPDVPIVPAHRYREWMQDRKRMYQCLPMLMANQSGWFLLNPYEFIARWSGEQAPKSVEIAFIDRTAPDDFPVDRYFGDGIITFKYLYLFRTPPGYNLLVRGPANWVKRGIAPLEGLVETDWAMMPFTMNWKFTEPNQWVKFAQWEPFCMIVPQKRHEIEGFSAQTAALEDDPDLYETYTAMKRERAQLVKRNSQLPRGQRRSPLHYFNGYDNVHDTYFGDHQVKLTLSTFQEEWPQAHNLDWQPKPQRDSE